MFSKFSHEEISPNMRGSRAAWVAGTSRNSQLSRLLNANEVANFDVTRACDKLSACVANLSHEQKTASALVTRKTTLSMASMLCYGTLRIHQQQVNNLLRKSSELAGVVHHEVEATMNQKRRSHHLSSSSIAQVSAKKGRYAVQFGATADSYEDLLQEVELFKEWSLQQSPKKSKPKESVGTLLRVDRNLLREIEPFDIDRPQHGLHEELEDYLGFGNSTLEGLNDFLHTPEVPPQFQSIEAVERIEDTLAIVPYNKDQVPIENIQEIEASTKDLERVEKTQHNVPHNKNLERIERTQQEIEAPTKDLERIENIKKTFASKRKGADNCNIDPKIARQINEPPIVTIQSSQDAINQCSVVPLSQEFTADPMPTEVFAAAELNDAALANVVGCQRKRKSTIKQKANTKRAKQLDMVLELTHQQQIDSLMNYFKLKRPSTVTLNKLVPANELLKHDPNKRFNTSIPPMPVCQKPIRPRLVETIDHADFLRDLLGMDSELTSAICKDWQLPPAGNTNQSCIPTETQENLNDSFKEYKQEIMDMELTPNIVQAPIADEDKEFGMLKLAGTITPENVLLKLLQFWPMNLGNRIDAKLFLAEQKYRFLAAATFNALLALHKQQKIALHHGKTNCQLIEIELLLPIQEMLTPPKEEILEEQDTALVKSSF